MLNKLKLLFIFLFISNVGANDFNKTFVIKTKAGHSFELTSEFVGEPVSNPSRLDIKSICSSGKSKMVLERFQVCKVGSVKMDKAQKTLILKLLDYNPDDAQCSLEFTKKIDISKSCK